MPLIVPRIDDRDYTQILSEALARIPPHNPEWKNFNDADPGVTLLQLFAFMADSLLYRANLIPERNRLKFLELLGIALRPPAAATGVAAIANERGPLDAVTLPAGLQLFAGATGFVTENGLDVLPVEGKVFYRAKLEAGTETDTAARMYTQLFGDGEGDDAALDFYRTTPFEWPVNGARVGAVSLTDDAVDHALWLAVLLRAADKPDDAVRRDVTARIAGKVLTLGIAPAWDGSQRVLRAGGSAARSVPQLSFDISTGTFDAAGEPVYAPLDAAADDDALENLTLVQLTLPGEGAFGPWDDLDPMDDGVGDLPPSLDDESLAARVLCWIRIRLADVSAPASGSTASQGWEARFSWLGVNATRISQRIPVAAQRVGSGTGEPDQSLALANVPVLPETVALAVNGELCRAPTTCWPPRPRCRCATPRSPPAPSRRRAGTRASSRWTARAAW
ncbi:MAG TPA: hypothetical protein VEX86_08045 [Longimicrobium sp.]|nr:hypothetical protein [Longimicrobium sp.]